ncbi:MAG TPA: DNRLRE domain-containing protein, partial [Thermoplasmata archaeon]|nr:DNRLRE domain-containing protein [Thermoplasmata archaeon]
ALEDTSQADFAAALLPDNVDLATSPGDVAILNGTQNGAAVTEMFQPGPAQVDDTTLWSGGGGNTNFGSVSAVVAGFWGANEWNRILCRFPIVLLPANATVERAGLRLYMFGAATPDPMELSVHRVVTDWDEMLATWNDYNGNDNWNASGGDYDPSVVDAIADVTTVAGWYEWNVTSLAQGWWSGTAPNYGLMVRQIDDESWTVRGGKAFYSSDAGNVSARPTLVVTYSTPESASGSLESRILDAGGAADWRSTRWSATVPTGASVALRLRTGDAAAIDATWSPWSSPYGMPGPVSDAPPGRYAQYRVTLSMTGVSPVVHDVALSFARFPAEGEVVTQAFQPAGLSAWGRLAMDATEPTGTRVELAVSSDDGASWIPATDGESLSSMVPDSLMIRVRLLTNDTRGTPWVHDLTLAYATVAVGGGGGFQIPVIAGVPVWVLLIPFGVLAAWTLTKDVRRRPFDATDLFLIHKDGRLIHRAGGEDGPVKDQDAVSAMFTVVAEFVKDSFGGNTNGRGDLKHFRVDDRDVAVAKVDYLFLALVGTGTLPATLDRNMKWFLRGVSSAHAKDLDDWDGLVERVGDVPDALDWFLAKGTMRRFLWPRHQFRCG